MRLWHYKLLHLLPDNRVLGQHRECCALRGKGWGRKHSTVDYVFTHKYEKLFYYHTLVMNEMNRRGFNVDTIWFDTAYRGKRIEYDRSDFTMVKIRNPDDAYYVEHNESYMEECLQNLKEKGVVINET